jgi:hypothetical protein
MSSYGDFNFYAPVTTPFATPSACSSIQDMSTLAIMRSGQVTTVSALWHDHRDPRYTSLGCAPPGWPQVDQDIFFFAPALCPADWTTVVAGTLPPAKLGVPASVAICCPR